MRVLPIKPLTAEVQQESVINLVIRLTQQFDELTEKKKSVTEQIDAMLDDDSAYCEFSEAAANASKDKKTMKEKLIAENHDLEVMDGNLKDVKEDIKMVQESLNEHLMIYYKQTGETSFDDGHGNNRKIKVKMSVSPGQMRLL